MRGVPSLLSPSKDLINHQACNITHPLRYDVELFQRIESLIEKKLPLFKMTEEEAMALVERVSEAQRSAKMVVHTL